MNDEWHTVKKGSSLRGSAKETKGKGQAPSKKLVSTNLSFYFENEEQLKNELRRSSIYKELIAYLTMFVSKNNNRLSIRALGVGSPTDSINASVQFHFLALIANELKLDHKIETDILIYDPVMTNEDQQLAKKYQMSFETNEDKFYEEFSKEENLLYYMPHCDKELYAKVLDLMEKRADSIVILGNSLRSYVDKHDSLKKDKNEAVERIRGYYTQYKETSLPSFDKVYSSFNDTFLVTLDLN